ncbi:hypothetical protein ACOSP7_009737 [Xanthoceras sorbifolium]|uniref:Uncharacterized protein n=1 Tax=Xanthoceras sorbifolium TaxID=99658 RepID=A0ABQ8HUD5_9ROSI|nr:hypothetical protein JRO89_XS07G0200000 [Xanthoceras sorbifolium]
MGCCISKCKPKKTYSLEDCYSHVQDKLVISQVQEPPKTTPNILVSNKISPCPLSPPTCSSSSSSFTCATSNTTDSCSSSLSTASSVLSSKDRSFSNEFLWSCVKENPHIIRINSIKEASLGLSTSKVQAHNKLDSLAKSLRQSPLKQSIPQKRIRSSSPTTLTRQKSFRKEPAADQRFHSSSSRTLRSPSPNRIFNGDNNRTLKDQSCSKRMVDAKVNAINSVSFSSYLKRENFRPASPSNTTLMGLRLALKNRETCTHRIGSKIDETAVQQALAHHESMEDIDNPLISLDCFIFL